MRCIVYGIGSPYLHEVVETLRRSGIEVAAYVNNQPGSPNPDGIDPVTAAADMEPGWRALPVVLPLTSPVNRRTVEREARALGFADYPSIIDPTAVAAADLRCGEGLLVNAAAVIGTRCTFGRFVLINRSASIGHDVALGDFVTIGPAASLGGMCRVETGAFIGIGAVIAPEVTVGPDAFVGAGAVVIRDIPEACTVFGNPARVIRRDRRASVDARGRP